MDEAERRRIDLSTVYGYELGWVAGWAEAGEEIAKAIDEDGFGGECSAVYERCAAIARRLAASRRVPSGEVLDHQDVGPPRYFDGGVQRTTHDPKFCVLCRSGGHARPVEVIKKGDTDGES